MNSTKLLLLSACFSALPALSSAMTSNDRLLAMNSYNNALYVVSGGNGYFVKDTTTRAVPGRDRFWQSCEQIEMVEDAWYRTGNTAYKSMVTELCNGLNNVISGTQDWASWNTFNDDVMWGVIAFARAYEITGNVNFLTQAEIQFNAVWSRGWDTALGGGLWQTTGKTSKNACINFPATIAAMILARNTVNTGFRNQANQLWSWSRAHLFNASTGQVYDHIDANGSVVNWAFTYNQGTMIGAAYLLYNDTGTASLKNDAASAALWTKNNLTGQHVAGILNDEYDSNGGQGDPVGFKGIFARWCGQYANGVNDSTIKTWLTTNANAAWSYRNNSGLMWAQWWHRTPDTGVASWECTSGVAMAMAAP